MVRCALTHVMPSLPGTPPAIFPLLCPVRERDWIPGWSARMLWSRSGVAEDGALFTTPDGWLWHLVRHDPDLGRIRFSVTAPGSHLLDLELHLAGTTLTWTYTLHALGPVGEAFIEGFEVRFPEKMALLERRLRHWLTHGRMLEEEPA